MTAAAVDTPTVAHDSAEPQAPSAVLMVRPHHYRFNAADCADNAFLVEPDLSGDALAGAAFDEITAMAHAIEARGVRVELVDDLGTSTPDSVFPNNWFSTHADGTLVLYPMRAPSRRLERRPDIVETLKASYAVNRVLDLSAAEQEGRFLEGTGAMVLDHVGRHAYVARSGRTDEGLLRTFCAEFDFTPVLFDANGPDGAPIYHTNVMMNVGTDLAMMCLDSIAAQRDRRRVRSLLEGAGRVVIPIDAAQMGDFAGNALELAGAQGPLLVMSSRGWASLHASQRATVEAHVDVLPVDIPAVEHSGGSARCTLAGIHLIPR
ncbi:MAG TPA: arginine deiminase-related protein [Phycicoccus sp.]|nr:arginine deiminase-related protein [Phycicoccus sp.]HRA45852.1 arginine deiminase-related protein [Phycicoccus sp.]